jgi:predicted ATP-dependent endonuclease of OLD family
MSSGEQNILIMLLELRRRLLPYSIVLIDEIENSLHPAFQRKLAEALKRMQKLIPFQLIVTTHALPMVETFGPASTRILTEF